MDRIEAWLLAAPREARLCSCYARDYNFCRRQGAFFNIVVLESIAAIGRLLDTLAATRNGDARSQVASSMRCSVAVADAKRVLADQLLQGRRCAGHKTLSGWTT